MFNKLFRSLLFVVLTVPVGLGAMEGEANKIELGKKLLSAITGGNSTEAEHLIEQGADLNQQDCTGDTSLIWASLRNDQTIARMLIDAGADLDCKNSTGCSALMIAAGDDKKDIVQMLIDAGADINLQNIIGETALMFAAHRGRDLICFMLIDGMVKHNAIEKERIYTFLASLKQTPGFARTNLPRDLFKSVLLPTLTDIAQEINRIKYNNMRKQLHWYLASGKPQVYPSILR